MPFPRRLFSVIAILATGTASADMKAVSGSESYRMDLERINAFNLTVATNWAGAAALYESLNQELTTYTAVNALDAASCRLMEGRHDLALAHLRQATRLMEDTGQANLERAALGWTGKEALKPFRGAPHERATAYALLGLLLLESGDLDNAAAAFKSGQLQDADAKQGTYQADYGLLMALESVTARRRGDNAGAKQLAELAVDAYRATHPANQPFVAVRAAREAAGGRASPAETEAIDNSVAAISAQLPADYLDPLLKEDVNTLLVIGNGAGPVNQRGGEHEEFLYVETTTPRANRFEVSTETASCLPVINGLANINFQATTRGGRMMDEILGGKSEQKSFLERHGSTLLDAARSVSGTSIGKIAGSIGFLMANAGLFANPESDYRYWMVLPAEFQIAPLTLPPGRHTVTITAFRDFRPVGTWTTVVERKADQRMRVQWVALLGGGAKR